MEGSAALVEQFKTSILKTLKSPSPTPNSRKRKLNNKLLENSDESDISNPIFIIESPRKKLRSSHHNQLNDKNHDDDDDDDDDDNDDDDDIDDEFNELFEIKQNQNDTDNEIDIDFNNGLNIKFDHRPIRRRRYFNVDHDDEEQENEEEKEENKYSNKYFSKYKNKNITFKCYNCDEVGHIARNCEYEPIEICFKCGECGHSGFYCSNTICSFCLGSHRIHECNQLKPNKNMLKFCIRCGSNQHYLTQCDIELNHRLNELQCFVCGKYGHLNCKTMNNKDRNRRIEMCSNCGDDGHTVYFCQHLKMNKAEIAIGLSTNTNEPKICFMCLTPDHNARNCPLSIRQKRNNINKHSFHYRSNEKNNNKWKRNKIKNNNIATIQQQKKWRNDTMKMIKQYDRNKRKLNKY